MLLDPREDMDNWTYPMFRMRFELQSTTTVLSSPGGLLTSVLLAQDLLLSCKSSSFHRQLAKSPRACCRSDDADMAKGLPHDCRQVFADQCLDLYLVGHATSPASFACTYKCWRDISPITCQLVHPSLWAVIQASFRRGFGLSLSLR